MAKTVTIAYHSEGHGLGLVNTAAAVLTPSSEEAAYPRAALQRKKIGETWRSKTGWTIRAGENDRIDFDRGGVKQATITAGTYATPTAMAAAVVAALEAADPTPVWACSYAAVVVRPTFTISTSAHTFALLFLTGVGATGGGSVHLDLGYTSTDKAAALSQTAEKPAYQSRHWLFVDIGAAEATIIAGVNDKLDFDRGGVKVATIEPGVYSHEDLAVEIQAVLELADPTPVWSVVFPTIGDKFAISADLAFTLLTGTGVNLATAIWSYIGFATGTDTSSDVTHLADDLPPHHESWTTAIVVGHNLSISATVFIDGFTASPIGTGIGTAVFGNPLPGDQVRIALFAAQNYRYIRVLIDDVQNPAGFAEVGVCYIGNYVTPTGLQNQGLLKSLEHLSAILYASNGAHDQVRRPRRRAWSLEWKLFTQAMEDLFDDLDDAMRIGGSFFLTFDSTGAPTTTTYYGALRQGLGATRKVGEVRIVQMEFFEALP